MTIDSNEEGFTRTKLSYLLTFECVGEVTPELLQENVVEAVLYRRAEVGLSGDDDEGYVEKNFEITQQPNWPFGKPEERKTLCVSSGHIHELDMNTLTYWAHHPMDKPLIVYDPHPGIPSWVAVSTCDVVDGDGQTVGAPKELSKECWHILVTAYKAGYDRVEFDGDAAVYNDLPFFSW